MSLQATFITSLIVLPAKEKSLLISIAAICDIDNEFKLNKRLLATSSGLSAASFKKIMLSFIDSGLVKKLNSNENNPNYEFYKFNGVDYLRSQNLMITVDEHGLIVAQPPQVNLNQLEIDKLTLKQKYLVYNRDGFKCLSCYVVENIELNHIIPLVKGGSNAKENLQTLCHKCAFKKGDEVIDFRTSSLPTEEAVTNVVLTQSSNASLLLYEIEHLTFDYELSRIADLVGYNGDVQAQWHSFTGHYIANKSPVNNLNIKTKHEWYGLWRKWVASSKGYQKDFLISKKRYESDKVSRSERREKKNLESNSGGFDTDIWDVT